jgi:hypothetical protein
MTTRKDAKRYYKVGDFTNTTGDIKKVVKINVKKRVPRRSRTGLIPRGFR